MMKIQLKMMVSAIGVAAVLATNTLAGTIASAPGPVASGPGLGLVLVPVITSANPNNDNRLGGEPDDNNLVIPLKRFDQNDYIDLVFTVNPSDGVTEYKVTEFVDNNTGSNWSKYTMQLGFGTGAAFQVIPSIALDFDAPGYDAPPTSAVMPVVGLSPTQLDFSGAIQGSGAQLYTFRVDVPDISSRVAPTFTLRQFPTAVPEPTALVLLGLAGLSRIVIRRRS